MGLVVDIGNTNTHVGIFDLTGGIDATYEFPTKIWFAPQINEKIDEMEKYNPSEGIALSSVVPEATKIAVSAFKTKFGIAPWVLSYKNAPLRLGKYPNPASLGADRIANAIGAARIHGVPAIVVSCGTAVTIDYVDKNHYFRGGAILPGISMFTHYLHEKTALLPEVKFEKYNRFYGKDTKTAILAGINKGFPAMIRTMIEGICSQFKITDKIIVATGAYSKLIEKEIGIIDVVDVHLTLEGLFLAWNFKEKKQCF